MSILVSGLRKEWESLDIMHADRRVAVIGKDGRAVVYYPSFMPYNLYLEAGDGVDVRVNNLNNFYYWCSSRVLTLDRKYAKEIMSSIGAKQSKTDKDRAQIAIVYRALSLTDVFWVKPKGEKKSFSSVSLYSHSLSDAFADVSLRGRQLTAQNAELVDERDAAGDVSTSGVCPKAWVREDGAFYLLKDGDERDVEAELIASKIADCFRIDHVSYSPAVFDGVRVSKCRSITSEQTGIVPFEYVEIYCANRGLDKIAFVLKKDAYSYYMMNVLDYLVGNTDRHWGNWGFFTDNRTNRLLGLYPLMDFNKAFTSYDTVEGARCLTVEGNFSQREAAITAVRKVGLNQISEVSAGLFGKDAAKKEMFRERLRVLKDALGRA